MLYVSTEVVHSLAVEVRRQSNQVRWLMRTPLLEQRPKKTNVIAVSMAALVESFYRSGLNAAMNARLSGQWGALFPNMHIQCPARILYINGFKGLRQYLDWKVKPDEYSNPTAARLCMSFAPGIIMTPLSSMLEASNAGHMNPEPITSRLRQAIIDMTSQPELQKRLRDLGIVPGGQSAAQVKAVFEKDRESFAAAVAAAEIKK